MHLKLSTDGGTLLPSPLVLESRVPFRMTLSTGVITCSCDIVEFVTTSDVDMALLPSFYLTLSFMPHKAILYAAAIDPAMKPWEEASGFRQYRTLLLSAHPLSTALIRNIEVGTPHKGWKQAVEGLVSETSSTTSSPLPPRDLPSELYGISIEGDLFQQWWAFDGLSSAFVNQFENDVHDDSVLPA